jgi:hypothetical protein
VSFVDLMSDDVPANHWSEADFFNRTESIKRGLFSDQEELALNRKNEGAKEGFYVLAADDIADKQRLALAGFAAKQAGLDARADYYNLLLPAWSVEAAQCRLAQEAVALDTGGSNQAVLEADQAERAAAQAVLDAASIDVMQLVERRALHRAPPELTPGPTEET